MPTAEMQSGATGAWLFPGQGSQQPGMGLDLLAPANEVRSSVQRHLDFDLEKACAGEPGYLDRTDRLQPVLYTVNYLHGMDRLSREGPPSVLAGHSLGEISALAVAGMLDFDQALRLVVLRGRLMHAASGGGMSAAVRIKADQLEELLASSQITSIDVANYNSPTETVLSGPVEDLRALTDLVRGAGGVLIPLKVSAPFHSRYMDPASDQLRAFIERLDFRDPDIPVISSVDAQEYSAARAGELLARQVREPVRWRQVVQALRQRGVREVVEVGPGQVLTKLWDANPKVDHDLPTPQPSSPVSTSPAAVTNSQDGAKDAPENRLRMIPPATTANDRLGSVSFIADYNVRHAYVAGSMYRGIAGTELVERMARSGYLSFLGTGGLSRRELEKHVEQLAQTCQKRPFGINLLHQPDKPDAERLTVQAALRHRVNVVEASAYTSVTPELVTYRYTGARLTGADPHVPNRLLAKVSRTEVAGKFLLPPPPDLIDNLHRSGAINGGEAEVARRVPLASDLCVESDSGGHTDRGSALVLIPSVVELRRRLATSLPAVAEVRVGAAGGLGTPAAIRAALALGAEFVLTGSINQCTPQAATSELVKDLLATLGVHDTAMAPAADLFEVDGRVQVVRKGTLFAARANRLQRIYREHRCWQDLDPATAQTIERQVLRKSFAEVADSLRYRYQGTPKGRLLDVDPKALMAAVFKTYLVRTTSAATEGRLQEAVDFQVHCGPSMGAFNDWVSGSELEPWRARDVDTIAEALIREVLTPGTSLTGTRRQDAVKQPAELTG